MKSRLYLLMISALTIILIPLSFNGLRLGETNQHSALVDRIKKCQSKYAYFFPIQTKFSSGNFIQTSSSFTSFCHCQNPITGNIFLNHSLSVIDYCSAKHLKELEHKKSFELNLELIIKPEIESLVGDNLRFAGPAIDQRSIHETKNCILRRIISKCTSRLSLERTKKCALTHLSSNELYQNIYKACHALEFYTHDIGVKKI